MPKWADDWVYCFKAWCAASFMMWPTLPAIIAASVSIYDAGFSYNVFNMVFFSLVLLFPLVYAISILPASFLGVFILVQRRQLSIQNYIFLVAVIITMSGAMAFYLFVNTLEYIEGSPKIDFTQREASSEIIGISIFAFIQSAIFLTALCILRQWDRAAAKISN